MSSDFSVEIPDIPGKITSKKQGSIYYVMYELDRTYYPEKKYTKVKRTMLGRVCPDNADRVFPNNNYFQYFFPAVVPEALDATKRSCCLKAGPYLVIKKVIEHYGLKEKLENHFGTDSGLLLDLASYFIVEEDNAGQYYPDYAYNHPLFTEEMKVLSDSTVSRFFQEVSTDQIIGFLDDWNATQDHRERIYPPMMQPIKTAMPATLTSWNMERQRMIKDCLSLFLLSPSIKLARFPCFMNSIRVPLRIRASSNIL